MLDLLIRGVAAVLVPLFYGGMALSALVVAITLVHDIRDFRSTDEPAKETAESL